MPISTLIRLHHFFSFFPSRRRWLLQSTATSSFESLLLKLLCRIFEQSLFESFLLPCILDLDCSSMSPLDETIHIVAASSMSLLD